LSINALSLRRLIQPTEIEKSFSPQSL